MGEVFIRAAGEDGKARLFGFGDHRVAREGVEVPAQRGDAARTQNLPPAGETGRQQRPRRARPRTVRRDAAMLHAVGQIAADDVEAAFAEEPRRVRAVAADNGQPAGGGFERVLVGGETEIPAERAETLFFFERVLEARGFEILAEIDRRVVRRGFEHLNPCGGEAEHRGFVERGALAGDGVEHARTGAVRNGERRHLQKPAGEDRIRLADIFEDGAQIFAEDAPPVDGQRAEEIAGFFEERVRAGKAREAEQRIRRRLGGEIERVIAEIAEGFGADGGRERAEGLRAEGELGEREGFGGFKEDGVFAGMGENV